MALDIPSLPPRAWLARLENLRLLRLEVAACFPEEVVLQDPACSVVRGLLGERLRDLRCITRARTCEGCSETARCDYARIFDGARPLTDPSLSAQDLHGYWLQGVPAASTIPAGAGFRAAMVMAGPALDAKAYLDVALRDALGRLGRTRPRAGATNRAGPPDRERRAAAAIELSASSIATVQWSTSLEAPRATTLRLEAVTPLLLRGDMAVCAQMAPRAPHFALVVRAAVRRLDALMRALAPGVEPARFGFPSMEDTEIVGGETFERWKGSRFSQRQHRRLPLEGVTGSMVVTGSAVPELVPLFVAAGVASVGKATTMGFGQLLAQPMPPGG